MEEIVFEEKVGNTEVICQFVKTDTGYIRKQIFPDGMVIEGDYTEEEYFDFLKSVKMFKELQENSKSKKGRKK